MGQPLIAEGQFLAVFNSTHRVLKAEGLLKAQGLPITLIPAPRAVQADCGLAIRFDEGLREPVMQFLADQSLLPAFLCQRKDNAYIIFEELTYENH